MSSSVVQAQWDLSGTSTDALSIGRGILIAATSDNVQPLAIMACERFGATLAMGRAACDHVNDHVLPTPDHAVVGFLKAMVGFAKNDSATELGRSHAGVQFLALAAALLSTMPAFESAQMVWAMLKASASDQVLLPRQSQVKDLLARLEPRCKPSRFFELAQEWQFRVHNWFIQYPGSSNGSYLSMDGLTAIPGPEGVEKLIDVFRQSRRIGSASVSRIEIRTHPSSAAWVAAFTEWCLDEKPSVYLESATLLHNNPASAVEIHILTLMFSFEVILHHRVDGPRSLVRTGGVDMAWTGMAKIELYGDWLLRQCQLDEVSAPGIVRDVLPSALHQVAETLAFSPYKAYNSSDAPKRWKSVERSADRPQIEEKMRNLRVYPFPGLPALSRTLEMLTGGKATELVPLKNGGLITDHPAVETYLRRLSETCDCPSCACSSPTPGSPGSSVGLRKCKHDTFFGCLSTVICDIYALSLFHYPEGLSVQVPILQHWDLRNDLRSAVERILRNGEHIDVSFTSLLDWALSLAGHRVASDVKEGRWVMSSNSGQVVWPTVYDTNSIAKYGFLGLSWLRGELRYRDEVYKLVQSDTSSHGLDVAPFSDPVVAPLNLVPDKRVAWEVQPGDDVLSVDMVLYGTDGRTEASASPLNILANYASALVAESCPHAHDTPLARPDTYSSFTRPGRQIALDSERTGGDGVRTKVVAVDGANELRMFALACCGLQLPVVLRQAACLGCCLDVCRRTGYPVLVL